MNVWTTLDPASRTRELLRLSDLFPCPVVAMHPPATKLNGVILAFPHSGREYPKSLLRASRLGRRDLRSSEDAFVDELIALYPEDGFARLEARFPRAWVDVNRHPDMLDPKLVSGYKEIAGTAQSPQVLAGLGVVPRVVAEGMPIYRQKLSMSEIQARLDLAWRPYHDVLKRMLANTVKAYGHALLVDCHSMPGPCRQDDKTVLADIVLGDGYGSTCDDVVTQVFESAFLQQGFRVARNNPYAGGHAVRTYGRCGKRQQAIQIEICREIYMDQKRIKKADVFESVSHQLTRALANGVRDWRLNVPQ